MKRMTPRDRLLTALGHETPDRVPFSWGFGPTPEMADVLMRLFADQGVDWFRLQAATDNKRTVRSAYIGPLPSERTDIWGIRRAPVSHGAGSYDEIEFHPLAGMETVEELDRHPWPNAADYDDANLQVTVTALREGGRYAICFGGGNPFEIYCWMTGLEEALINLKTNPELVQTALAHITDFFVARIRAVFERIGPLVDVLFIADDLGGQTGLLMARESYRTVIQPSHARLTRTAGELSPRVKIMFHTDGAVFEIIPDLLEVGVDILEAVQTDAAGMSPEALKSTYGDRLCFQGGISVQQLLPHAHVATVERECQRLVDVFGRDGGYIAAPSHAIQVGTPPENVLAMLRTILGEADLEQAFSEAMSERRTT